MGTLAYGGPVAVAERDLTSGATRGVVGLFPWRGVVAPWLLSRVLSIVVLLAAVNDPARGSRFVQVATRWDGAFYLDIARNGYGRVDIPFPKWPFFPLLPGLIRALSEVADDKAAIFVLNQILFLVALAGVHRLDPRPAPFLDRTPDPHMAARQLLQRQARRLECALIALRSRDGEVLRPAPPKVDVDRAAALAHRQHLPLNHRKMAPKRENSRRILGFVRRVI